MWKNLSQKPRFVVAPSQVVVKNSSKILGATRFVVPVASQFVNFCQVASCTHRSCQKCLLYTNDDDVDEVAMLEAAFRAAEEIREKSASVQEEIVDINIEDILRKPK
jgi:hypothetical protein